jgi:Skp family chaperone for outer membrane proteins
MVGQPILSLDNNFKKKVLYFLKQNVMRKQFLILFLVAIVSNTISGQAKGSKVGYIDMEYILENTTSYKEANAQLEEKAQKWKLDIETKKAAANKLKEALKAETPLLTNELIKEREAEIAFLESETLDYQQKRFGANGDLMIQKASLAKPIQDQVFTAIQDIAVAKKYDYIFDKSSDLTMLFAAKRLDISDQVLRVLNRTEKREQLSKKELKVQQEKEAKEDAANDTSDVSNDRQTALDARKAKLVQAQEERKAAYEAKKKEMEEKRNQILAEREARKNGTVSATTPAIVNPNGTTVVDPAIEAQKKAAMETAKKATDEARQKQVDERANSLAERQRIIEERKKALEEKRKKTLEDREAAKKALETKPEK